MKEPDTDKNEPNWYVRLPLWAQTTILILVIGLTSIIVLVIIAGTKVYHYSENLIRSRLSNLAGMTALQIERTFSGDLSFVNLYLSNPDVIDIFRRANQDELTLDDMFGFDTKLTVDSTMTSLWGITYYTSNLTKFYNWNRRGMTSTVPADTARKFPYETNPLSFKDLAPGFLEQLVRSNGNALANYSFTSKDLSGVTNYGYSVTQEVYGSSTPLRSEGYRTSEGPIGYVTFSFLLPIYSADNPLSVLSDKGETSAFGKYTFDIVRERDVNLNNTADEYIREYYGSLNVPPRTFKFLLPSNNTLFNISNFPVISDASQLTNNYTNNQYTIQSSASNYNLSDTDYNVTLFNSQIKPVRERLVVKIPSKRNIRWDEFGRQVGGAGPQVYTVVRGNQSTNTSTYNATSTATATTSTSQATPQSTSQSSSQGWGDVIGKPTYATLRTTSPFFNEATIGYSFALVANEKWLIFTEVPRKQAFSELNYVVDSTIYVGVGVLGVVLLIALPLSKWQTRGVYLIYKNMRLRPLFILDHDDDNVSPKMLQQRGTDESLFYGLVPKNNSWWIFHGWAFKKKKQNDESYSTIDDSSSKSTSKVEKSISDSSNSGERYRFTVPLPLPQLARWYTDELDELVDEFNLMVSKLNNHYHHLEDQVKLRTREAQRSGELREKANVAKSEFIAIISHELRTPLNGIMGLTAVNAEETDITKIRSGLETIIESGRILMDLLNELLVLSKSLVGVDPAVSEFTPNLLLEMLSNLFLSRVKSAPLTANFALGCEPAQLNHVRMRGDVDHVVQICVNFMSNANKFSEVNGHSSVILHLRPLIDSFVNIKPYKDTGLNANAVLEILVTDSGTGISKEQLGRIFDLFVQGDNPLRKNHKGAGLGMSLSKQLAEGIGGYVTVFSMEDIGSTVALRVPVEVMDLNIDEINQLNGPMLEFRVPEVYSTMSLNPGEVRMIPELSLQQKESSPLLRNVKHTRHHARNSSVGSRMLLQRGQHTVTKLLKSQHNHQSSNSKSSGSLGDVSSDVASGKDVATPQSINSMEINIVSGSIEAVSGTHAQSSATSLLANHPQDAQSIIPDHKSSSASSQLENASNGLMQSVLSRNNSSINLVSGQTLQKPTTETPKELSVNTHQPPSLRYVNHTPDPISASTTTTMHSQIPQDEQIGHMRVLLAEDNKLNQQIMVKMLEQLGVKQVDTAEDGNTVITMVEKSIVGGFHYHVIFMDLSMPGKNGIEATQIIRGTLGYPYPIVALTGFSDSQTINACLEVNIEEVLTKPVMKNDILRVLRRCLTEANERSDY